jgi:plasmid replication initiation protein
MREITIAQDNRLTSARYELSLIEKRVFYLIIKEIRDKHVTGSIQRDLFDDMNLKINVSELTKQVNARDNNHETKKALKSLRKRSFEWSNGLDENDKDYEWFEVGFINYSEIKNGIAEIQISKKLMPFLVELSGHFTPYSLNVAMSLKSKWSQRMYELCQKWHGTDGFRISIDDLRKSFMLENKYSRYALLNEFVLQIAKRELKELYDIGQCDVYFEFNEERKGRSVEMLRFKLFRKNSMNVKTTHDMLLELIPVFSKLFDILNKNKNDHFIRNVIDKLQRNPNLIEPLNKRVKEILSNGIKEDTPRYIRFILNEDVLNYSDGIKLKTRSENKSKEVVESKDVHATLINLSNDKKI